MMLQREKKCVNKVITSDKGYLLLIKKEGKGNRLLFCLFLSPSSFPQMSYVFLTKIDPVMILTCYINEHKKCWFL